MPQPDYNADRRKPRKNEDDGITGRLPPSVGARDKLLRALQSHHRLEDVKEYDMLCGGSNGTD